SKQTVSLEEANFIQGSNVIYKNTQTYLNTKEILILAECGTMDYSTLELQETHNSNISNNIISKRKREPELSQEDTNKHPPTLTKSIIQNSKRSKEDASVISQQNTENTISLLKDEQPPMLLKKEDIYSSQ
ncbi:1935_t:CDS:1, partial [Gigaspora margarita]